MPIIEYEIVEVDYFEQDAFLVIGNNRLYFQWNGIEPPTIFDAIRYVKNEIDSKYIK